LRRAALQSLVEKSALQALIPLVAGSPLRLIFLFACKADIAILFSISFRLKLRWLIIFRLEVGCKAGE